MVIFHFENDFKYKIFCGTINIMFANKVKGKRKIKLYKEVASLSSCVAVKAGCKLVVTG